MQTLHSLQRRIVSVLIFGLSAACCADLSRAQDLRLGPGRQKKKEGSPAELKTQVDKPVTNPEVGPLEIKPIEIVTKNGESTAQAWNALFAKQRNMARDSAFDRGVRAKVRRLIAAEDFKQIEELISAALRNDAMQTWMYEALALAMEASGATENEIERAVLSTVDLSRDQDSALTAAGYLASLKLDRAALRLFQDVSSQDPLRTEPYIQGLRCAQNLNDVDGIQWCCLGILRQAWPSEQKEIEQHAKRVAEATIAKLEKEGYAKRADQFLSELAASLCRDVRVRITWTGDADVDLSVMEPSGEVCSYRNPRTAGGGVMMGDTFARSAVASPREGFTETFLCPEGFTGQYQLLLKRVWGDVAGGKVNVEVVTHYGAAGAKIIKQELPLGKDGTLVKFELDKGRRTQPLPEARATAAAARQIEVARHVLAQQFESNGSASSESYYSGRTPTVLFDPLGRLAIPLGRGAVGFRPQITTLRDGPQLFAGPAVVSADRRFVRMTLSPVFQTIGDVQTFNFATGSVGNGNGSGNTPGTGGGAGGGAGGGTGGGGGTGT